MAVGGGWWDCMVNEWKMCLWRLRSKNPNGLIRRVSRCSPPVVWGLYLGRGEVRAKQSRIAATASPLREEFRNLVPRWARQIHPVAFNNFSNDKSWNLSSVQRGLNPGRVRGRCCQEQRAGGQTAERIEVKGPAQNLALG